MKADYRSEIDGLRAISVFAVIFYHANFLIFDHEIFQGGFIGVDIFFVISGYLITTLILREIFFNNDFSIIRFYIRRVRRIIPVLFIVILVCIPCAYFIFLPSSLIDFLKSALSSLGFVSNYYFHHTGLIYGGPDSSLKPLLHTWSLSVEEQFYIIFPILLIFVNKFLRSNMLKIFILFFLISFITTQIISTSHPLYNFYFINVRIWELLAGSIIAYLEIKRLGFKKNVVTSFLPFFGLVLILFSIFFLNDKMSLPSFYSFPAVLGTCLIIFFSNKDNLIFKILSLKFIVFMGLISYSLYLWHYPLFSFYNYVYFSNESFLIKILIIILSIILSILSYYFIEKPFRNKNIINNKKLLIFVSTLFLATIILTFSLFYKTQNSQKGLYEKINLDKMIYVTEVDKKLNEIKLKNNFDKKEYDLKKNILIIGNSHAEDMFLIFKTNTNLFSNYNFEYSNFELLINKVMQKKKNDSETIIFSEIFKKTDIILLSNNWSENDIIKLETFIEPLIKTKKKIIISNQNVNLPSVGKRNVTLLDQFVIIKKRLPSNSELIDLEKKYFDYMINDAKRNRFNNKLNIISKKYKLKLLDKSIYQCNYKIKRCKILTPDGDKINFNTHHHTLNGTKYLGETIYVKNWLDLNY